MYKITPSTALRGQIIPDLRPIPPQFSSSALEPRIP